MRRVTILLVLGAVLAAGVVADPLYSMTYTPLDVLLEHNQERAAFNFYDEETTREYLEQTRNLYPSGRFEVHVADGPRGSGQPRSIEVVAVAGGRVIARPDPGILDPDLDGRVELLTYGVDHDGPFELYIVETWSGGNTRHRYAFDGESITFVGTEAR